MLIGRKIVLRPLKSTDLEKTHEWRNNLEIIKLTQGIRFPKTLEMDREWFNQALSDKSNRNIYFGIDVIATFEFIGIIQLNNVDYISGTANWGLVIGDKNHRGKGYSKEAATLLFDYAFNELNIRKINGYRIGCNNDSYYMLNSLGFTEEGILKRQVFYDGQYHDVHVSGLFKEDYKRNKNLL